ncbi:hypothetical protein QQF64_006242 [Cirrhinus molitorella]|uniref:Uncharacterized protein n=1 Tax=Cirrhinus molitorella TaxID=172907 RepID=A0ABR3MEI8_9TELE
MNRGAPFVWPLSSSTINTEPCDASPQSKRCISDRNQTRRHGLGLQREREKESESVRERGKSVSSGINQVIKQE